MIKQALGCILLSMSINCQADIAAQAIAFNCLICHDSDKRPDAAQAEIPGLLGLQREALTQALLDFKYDRRAATLMSRIAKGYSDDELRAVAAFLTSP